MNRFEYTNAASAEQAVSLLKDAKGQNKGQPQGQTVIKAGGIDLLDRMKLAITEPQRLVNITSSAGSTAGLSELRKIKLEAGGLQIGATATLSELASHGEIQSHFAAIAQAAGSAANPQIRNLATAAGNLLQRPRCWYYRNPDFPCFKKGGVQCFAKNGENRHHAIFGGGPSYIVHPSTMATALQAFSASIRIARAGQKDRDVSLDQFFTLPSEDEERENNLKPDELITHILVPPPEPNTRSVYLVAKERQVYDWPLAEVAVVLVLKGITVVRARIVLGAAAPIPWRAVEAEKALIGKRIGVEVVRAAAAAAVQNAQPLSDNGYKVPLFTALVERALLAAVAAHP